MSFSHLDHPAATPPRVVTTSGQWVGNREHDHHGPSSPLELPPDLGLAAALFEAAERMHNSSDPEQARHAIAHEALQFLPADGVIVLAHAKSGLTPVCHLTRTGSPADPDTSTALCRRLAGAQLLEPGVVSALELHRAQQALAGSGNADNRAPARWRSVLVADLDPRDSRPARLLWYATTSDAFPTTCDLAVLFARHAGLALRHVTERDNLQWAVESRTATGQATGIVMHRYRLTAEQAFETLRRYSQEHNIKLRDVAEAINRTGEPPPDDRSSQPAGNHRTRKINHGPR